MLCRAGFSQLGCTWGMNTVTLPSVKTSYSWVNTVGGLQLEHGNKKTCFLFQLFLKRAQPQPSEITFVLHFPGNLIPPLHILHSLTNHSQSLIRSFLGQVSSCIRSTEPSISQTAFTKSDKTELIMFTVVCFVEESALVDVMTVARSSTLYSPGYWTMIVVIRAVPPSR